MVSNTVFAMVKYVYKVYETKVFHLLCLLRVSGDYEMALGTFEILIRSWIWDQFSLLLVEYIGVAHRHSHTQWNDCSASKTISVGHLNDSPQVVMDKKEAGPQ